jgi:hypothetical protein
VLSLEVLLDPVVVRSHAAAGGGELAELDHGSIVVEEPVLIRAAAPSLVRHPILRHRRPWPTGSHAYRGLAAGLLLDPELFFAEDSGLVGAAKRREAPATMEYAARPPVRLVDRGPPFGTRSWRCGVILLCQDDVTRRLAGPGMVSRDGVRADQTV